MEIITLNNGLSILFRQMLNTHAITIGLYIKAGSGNETKQFNGATHLLEHLSFRRCGNFSQEELYYKMECMGSTLRAVTYRDFLQFTMKVRTDKLEEGVEIFRNLISGNNWTDTEFEKEKQVVINQILEKGYYISLDREVGNAVFRTHPLSGEIMGDIETINSLNKYDMQKFKEKIFTAENMIFCITGNVSNMQRDDIVKELEKITIKKTGQKRKLDVPKWFGKRKPDVFLKQVQDDNRLDVNISFDITYCEEMKDLLTILNCILGEGVGSRLQKCIREEKCYSSDIASYIEWYQNFAVLHIRFSVDKRSLLNCINDIVVILKKMKVAITKQDLDITLPFYTANQIFYEDDTEEMNFQLAYNQFVLGIEYRDVSLKNNEETIQKLQKLSSELFVKNNISIVVIGDTGRLTKKSIVQIVENI